MIVFHFILKVRDKISYEVLHTVMHNATKKTERENVYRKYLSTKGEDFMLSYVFLYRLN